MNLEELYRGYASSGDNHRRVEGLLNQTHWLSFLVDFDPRTGQPMPTSFTEILRRSSTLSNEGFPKDRVWHAIEHSRASVQRLIAALTEEPRRKNEYMPVRDVRELDTSSFVALSKKPGRNIREKLADKPYMQAVRHYQSLDTTENRLLKAYANKLVELLTLRHDYLGESDALLSLLQRWLRSDEALSISRWENLPPNNTLISHRDYRRVWDSWRWLQTIDDDIDRDNEDYSRRCDVQNHWNKLANAYAAGETQFAEMPVIVDWDGFEIRPWVSTPVRRQKKTKRLSQNMPLTHSRTAVDLSLLTPAYSSDNGSGLLADSFIWQRWSNDHEGDVEICLFGSDAAMEHPDATTVMSPDLLFSKHMGEHDLNAASAAFAERMSQLFETPELVWITPDSLNEFDLKILRRNINSYFPSAEPLPCSVAAVLENIAYAEITGDGYSVAVVETMNSVACITVLTARFSEELYAKIPETRGYVWERDIPRIARRGIAPDAVGYRIASVDSAGEWHNKINPYGTKHKISSNIVESDANGEFNKFIALNTRPVVGGLKLMAMQKLAGGTPIWRNKIPELMTKVFNEATGQMEYFYFVGKGTTIEPVRGRAKKIPINQDFVIPAGKAYFKLWQGTNDSTGADGEAIEHVAFLRSPDMPFDQDVACRLSMIYTYGADDPFSLVFHPLNRSLAPIQVEWKSKSEIPPENVPGPSFPEPLSWESLRRQISPRTGKSQDLLEWALESGRRLVEDSVRFNSQQKEGEIEEAFSDWRTDRNGKRHTYAFLDDGTKVWIHEGNFVDSKEAQRIGSGNKVFFFAEASSKGSPKGQKGLSVSVDANRSANDYLHYLQEYVKRIPTSVHFPFIKSWADGRSLRDADCPQEFRNQIVVVANKMLELVHEEEFPISVKDEFLYEFLFLFSCMGDDMPQEVSVLMAERAKSAKKPSIARFVGFALGSVSEPWQKGMLSWVLSIDDEFSLRILSNAAWRSPWFIQALTVDMVKTICPRLMNTLNIAQHNILSTSSSHKIKKYIFSNTVRYLELVLALLRTRESEDPELRDYLQPHQKRCKTLYKHVMRLSDSKRFCEEATSKSRIKLTLPPRLEDEADLPDLLYALKIYLSGDDRFNAIRITDINEE